MIKLRIAALFFIAGLSGCSGAPSGEQQGPAAKTSTPTLASKGEPAQRPIPDKSVSPVLNADYCLAHGNDPDKPFGNSKACFMAACDRGDKPSCRWAAEYNGNMVQDETPVRSGRMKLEGMNYRAARKIVLQYGWQPLAGPCSGIDDKTCKQFPEIGNCSGTGLGYCDMNFARKQKCLIIITTEGPPSDDGDTTQVRDVVFSNGPCAKDPNDR